MNTATILTHPNPLLRKKSSPVESFTIETRDIADLMVRTMQAANGIGIAAPQIGIHKRIIVVGNLVMLNPHILRHSDTLQTTMEGCLSVESGTGLVERPDWVRVKWQDLKGRKRVAMMDGLMAVCVQHEIDHLEGVLFIDRGMAKMEDAADT